MASSDADQRLAELVPLAQAVDAAALQEIIKIVHPMVLRYARARISSGRTPTAEDLSLIHI